MRGAIGCLCVVIGGYGSIVATPAHGSTVNCDSLLAQPASTAPSARAISALDLIRLRDIVGEQFTGPDTRVFERLFDVSAAGNAIAVTLRRAEPSENGYCTGTLIVRVGNQPSATLVDRSFEVASATPDRRGQEFGSPLPSFGTPRFSPDGEWVAYLKRVDRVINVWRARVDGNESEQVTRSLVDVDDFAWAADGRAIIFSSRSGLPAAMNALEEEGLGGFHFDERFSLFTELTPYPAGVPLERFAVDLATKRVRNADESEAARLEPGLGDLSRSRLADVNERGDEARIVSTTPGALFARTRLELHRRSGEMVACDVDECRDVSGAWWSSTEDAVYFSRRQGWARSQTAIYLWRPGSAPARTFVTGDVLSGCVRLLRELLCGHEASTTPMRLILINPDSGSMRPFFDPNPETASWRFGSVERLHWRNENGAETIGDLVLPPDHRPAERHPVVVVGYMTRGFLRGGTGDEHPIQLYAARGYAVLSFERPQHVGTFAPASPGPEVNARATRNWSDRRNVQASLESGIRLLQSRGIVDGDRVGLTGFSDGATTAKWAILNSSLFAVASLSQCCYDPTSIMAIAGFATADRFRSYGYPSLMDSNDDFYRPLAFELNAQRVEIPILIQSADSEIHHALASLARFRELNRPVDTFIFLNERHVKWQPAHRLAVYQRNLDWFDFWLRGIENDTPGRPAEYARWREMRSRRDAAATEPARPAATEATH